MCFSIHQRIQRRSIIRMKTTFLNTSSFKHCINFDFFKIQICCEIKKFEIGREKWEWDREMGPSWKWEWDRNFCSRRKFQIWRFGIERVNFTGISANDQGPEKIVRDRDCSRYTEITVMCLYFTAVEPKSFHFLCSFSPRIILFNLFHFHDTITKLPGDGTVTFWIVHTCRALQECAIFTGVLCIEDS